MNDNQKDQNHNDENRNWFRGYVLPILIGVAIAFIIRTWIGIPARVPSASMYPTIPAKDQSDQSWVLVNKMATEFGKVHRGEVVVFHYPKDPKLLYVKRVIGLPGDTVTVTETAVYINGQKLDEPNPGIAKSNGTKLGTYKVPPGEYFMMGDNRPVSDDSRYWGSVKRSAIVGEADFVLYPFNKMGGISQSLK